MTKRERIAQFSGVLYGFGAGVLVVMIAQKLFP